MKYVALHVVSAWHSPLRKISCQPLPGSQWEGILKSCPLTKLSPVMSEIFWAFFFFNYKNKNEGLEGSLCLPCPLSFPDIVSFSFVCFRLFLFLSQSPIQVWIVVLEKNNGTKFMNQLIFVSSVRLETNLHPIWNLAYPSNNGIWQNNK